MTKKSGLRKLMEEECKAYKKKCKCYKEYRAACEKDHEIYIEVASTWGEFKKAELEFKTIFDENKIGIPSSQDPWQKYLCTKARNLPEVARLKEQAEAEEAERIEILKQVRELHKEKRTEEIVALKLEAKDHEDARKRLSAEIQDLKNEIAEAKNRAKNSEPYVERSKKAEDALTRHENAKREHKKAKLEKVQLKARYEKSREEHELAKERLEKEKTKIAKK